MNKYFILFFAVIQMSFSTYFYFTNDNLVAYESMVYEKAPEVKQNEESSTEEKPEGSINWDIALSNDEAKQVSVHKQIGNLVSTDTAMDVGIIQAQSSGTDDYALNNGIAHDPTTGLPGEGQPIVMSGHRELDFFELFNLEQGQKLTIKMGDNNFDFEVTEMTYIDLSQADVVFGDDEEVLVLYTCYPQEAFSQITGRWVVKAKPLYESPGKLTDSFIDYAIQ